MRDGSKPAIFVEAETIPEGHWKALKAVWDLGIPKRTQYDRKDSETGEYIDPPSKEASVWLRINNPFAEPRYSPLAFSYRGEYILELLGVKNEKVVSRQELLEIEEKKLKGWPYSYSQRLEEFPTESGKINQIDNVIERLADDYNTRRAVMTTRCPELDTRLKEDIPCLGEVHFTMLRGEDGKLYLSPTTVWRSRDSFKGMPDNMIGATYRTRRIAERLSDRIGEEVIHGTYDDFSTSLHIYGQDFTRFQQKQGGGKPFFEVFPTAESYAARSMDSATARDSEILGQMKAMLTDKKIKEWNLTKERIKIIEHEIEMLEHGYTP